MSLSAATPSARLLPMAVRPDPPHAEGVVSRLQDPCGRCTFSWCDAPWSSGRTGCPACPGRAT
ncbi:hypothetical protein V6Z72_20890 [Cereibacter sphaeroides]|uniref:hypothetical protein n=1 Tax=Cereibacter sphaeroides TaxID=1063 RepID=UPI003990739A